LLNVVFGLGNPGKKYQGTRHNIGFLFLDYYADRFGIPFVPGKGDYFFTKINISGKDLYLVKPRTYMNLSGLAVREVVDTLALTPEDILVVYDDFHLPFGTLRFRKKGSAGGHNGIKSIVGQLGTENFPRLRLGIGPPPEASSVIDFVLAPFAEKESAALDAVMEAAWEGVQTWHEKGIEFAMNNFNKNVLAQ